MHGSALKRNASASKHSYPCSISFWSAPLHQHPKRVETKYQICSFRNSGFLQLLKTLIMWKESQDEDFWPWILRKAHSKHKCENIHQGKCALVGSVVFHINKTNCHHTKSLHGQSEARLEKMRDCKHPFDSKCFFVNDVIRLPGNPRGQGCRTLSFILGISSRSSFVHANVTREFQAQNKLRDSISVHHHGIWLT